MCTTMRRLRRQSMYRQQWLNHGQRTIRHPKKLSLRQRVFVFLSGLFTRFGRDLMRVIGG